MSRYKNFYDNLEKKMGLYAGKILHEGVYFHHEPKKNKTLKTTKNISKIALLIFIVFLVWWVYSMNLILFPTAIGEIPRGNVYERIDEYGMGPVHRAVLNNDILRLQKLIKIGFKINHQDEIGWTPLHWASLGKNIDMVSILKGSGANTDIKSTKKWVSFKKGIKYSDI